MTKIRVILALLFLLFTPLLWSQRTNVSATITDNNGTPYVNCSLDINFVGINPPPGTIYTLNGATFPQSVPGQRCDGFGHFTVQLPDNNIVQPTPSQWRFSICSTTGYSPGNQYCFTAQLTITGTSQDISATLKPLAPILPLGYPFPLTQKGDLFGYGGPGVGPLRVPVGADGNCLVASSASATGLTYGACGSGGGGGGSTMPGGGPGDIQVNVSNTTFGGVTSTGKGSELVSAGTLQPPAYQTKPRYDVRDWMTCDGSTNATTGMNTMLAAIGSTEATVNVVGTCVVAVLHQPANVTFDFSSGGAIQLITNSTSPGGSTFVQGSGQSNPQASPTSTCSATLTGISSTNTLYMAVAVYATFGPDNARINSVTDGGDLFVQQSQTTLGNAPYIAVYAASYVLGGTRTITANLSHSEKNACIAWEVSGQGPVVQVDGSNFNYGTTTPFSTGAATLAAGDFVLAFGEDPNGAQTCTAGGGYTQPASTAGNVSGTSGVSLCGEYIANGAGGSTSATQNFSSSPVASSWGAILVGFKPGTATWNALGGIIDPDLHQICINCTGTNGILDFTGNTVITNVYPEWWGACNTCSAATNTPAIQASEIGAFGTKRVNGSGLNQYNKVWTLTSNYSINAEIKFYHVSGASGSRAQIWCSSGGGLTQTASNLRILDGQSDAYLRIDNCSWVGGGGSTTSLVDFGYSAAQGVDFAPQFIDFYSNTWVGNNQTAIGFQLAKEGGGAQGSNVYCYDCEVSGFTTAGWQIGTPSALAQNALDIGYSGDMQSCPQYGLANYGGGYITVGGGTGLTTMENGFSTQTGFDVYSSTSQGPLVVEHYRSESRKLFFCSNCQIRDAFAINQSVRVAAGATQPVGTIMSGSQVGGDGAYYKVTVDGGPFGGTGSPQAQIIASGGSPTTLVNTNQTLTGSVTVGALPGASQGETMTQASTGATGVRRNSPANSATITGAASGAQIILNETMTQASTGVTCTEQAPTPVTGTSQNLICNNFSGTADSSHAWTGGTSGGVYTPSAAPSFAVASPVLVLGSVTGSPDSSHVWTGGTSGGVYTPTQAPQPANYTVNAFTGMITSVFTGTNALCYGSISSNTSTTITVSSWITRYPGVQCPGPDSTSTFIVEPGWSHAGTVTSGGMQLQYVSENVIDGDNGASGTFEDVIGYGGQWHMAGSPAGRTIIRHGQVSRQDWYTPIGSTPQATSGSSLGATNVGSLIDGDWDVGVFPPGADRPQSWSNLTSGGATVELSAAHRNLGNRKLCWNAVGSTGGTTPANEVCIGGRSDPNSTTDSTRALVEIKGFLGSPAPVPATGNSFSLTNVAGTETDITGGPSTGSANGGGIGFYISTPGSSGTSVNTGTKQWLISGSTGNLVAQGSQTATSAGFNTVPSSNFGQASLYTSAVCETAGAPTTLNTGATTTTTGQTCLPATAIIDAVVYRITTTITTAASFTIGDGTVATRFCGTQSTLTAGTTGTCFAQADQTGTSGPRQVSAAAIVITTNANPGAGAIRLFVFYHTWTPPTS